ncbi:MAG TPA: hypothetical protein V6C57_19950 [Coleofasciculaceae cyanobacterium]
MLTPYEILVRFNSEGAFQGASIKHWDSDRSLETPPEDLGSTSDPRFQEIVGTALTAANTQVAELQAQLAAAQSEAQVVPELRSQISQLEQELEQYRNPPQPAQDWVGLGGAIATSSLYTRLTGLIEDDVLTPPLETTLLSTLFRMGMAAAWIRSLPAFLEGVSKLREILAGTEHAITPEEEVETVALLTQYGFMPPSV